MTIQLKAIEQYLPVVLFIMLYKVVLTFESVDEIRLPCCYSDESFSAVLSYFFSPNLKKKNKIKFDVLVEF